MQHASANPILVERFGYQLFPDLLPREKCDILAAEMTALLDAHHSVKGRTPGGLRNLLRLSKSVAELATSDTIFRLLEVLTGEPCFPVRAIFFDKTPDANWSVPWHQDLAIAVRERIDTPGFGPWSVKEGVPHTQPPAGILEKMLTVRLHLDDCNANNGALKLIPGSHRQGEYSAAAIAAITSAILPFVCETPASGALVMRPLLLHSSTRCENPRHRRILHIEYANQELPNNLEWFDRP